MQIRSSLIGCKQSGITVLRRSLAGDGAGGQVEDYLPLLDSAGNAVIWQARIYNQMGEMRREEPGIIWQTTHEAQGEYCDLKVDDRLVDDAGSTYEVKSVEQPGGWDWRTAENTKVSLIQINEAAGG